MGEESECRMALELLVVSTTQIPSILEPPVTGLPALIRRCRSGRAWAQLMNGSDARQSWYGRPEIVRTRLSSQAASRYVGQISTARMMTQM